MSTRKRHPVDTVGINVAATWAITGQRRLVDFGQSRLDRVFTEDGSHDCARITDDRPPDGPVGRANSHRVFVDGDTLVLAGLDRLTRLDIFAPLAITGCVQNK